jgi:hypothetical protein
VGPVGRERLHRNRASSLEAVTVPIRSFRKIRTRVPTVTRSIAALVAQLATRPNGANTREIVACHCQSKVTALKLATTDPLAHPSSDTCTHSAKTTPWGNAAVIQGAGSFISALRV